MSNDKPRSVPPNQNSRTMSIALEVVGAIIMIVAGIMMAIGQVIPVFIGCFVAFILGCALLAAGKKMGAR